MLSIGDFSRVTQLTIKALRLYHEKGILVPDIVDESSGYRYYGPKAVERADRVKRLKDMGFSLDEIREILEECRDDGEIVERVEKKLGEVEQSLRQYKDMKIMLSQFLMSAEARRLKVAEGISLETIPDMLICGIRFKGKYHEVGLKMAPLFRKCGRQAAGPPFSLYYDAEFKEDDADIEVSVEVKKRVSAEGIECHELKGGKAATIIHKGPYEFVGRGYQKLYEYCSDNAFKTLIPIREQYIKAPGVIFRGNPKNYLTKLILPFA